MTDRAGFEAAIEQELQAVAAVIKGIPSPSSICIRNAEMTPVALRVTSIFRPEEGAWKLVHRHADTITSPQSADSVITSKNVKAP